ncbi:MAG: hypothetical protein RML15_02415 [Bacteroidota bacterium]|nr:hypothetical protein [Candidatus Kapabacteria bacterium]MCS7302622.1 hypothetical protein [Candidatus Kapabacteria bacterium]MCX7936444.1 hypothetical protein [Chlorobiota bacterium]MDW8074276.1 hypothetical protein [Bacteroidota bacterium]MDW8271248.1 hypothetical protein [Bacteroidota bacterium]
MFPSSKVVALILLACIGSTLAIGQEDSVGRAARRLAQFKKLRLIEILNLDESTAEKFFVRYNEGQKKIDQARQAMQQSVRQLEEAIRANAPDAELNAKSEQVIKQIQQVTQAIIERQTAVRPLLTAQQYAKLVVFEVRFMEALQRVLQQRGALKGLRERDRRRLPPFEQPD